MGAWRLEGRRCCSGGCIVGWDVEGAEVVEVNRCDERAPCAARFEMRVSCHEMHFTFRALPFPILYTPFFFRSSAAIA